MYVPPIDPRDPTESTQPTWQNVAISYALLGAVLLSLWVISNPVAGTAALTAFAVVAVGGHRTVGLVRCLRDCGAFAFDPVGDVRVTVSRRSADVERANDAPDASGTTTCC